MDSRLINAIVAEFGLDILKFNDEFRHGTKVPPPHCDKDKVPVYEDINRIYTEASKSEFGRHVKWCRFLRQVYKQWIDLKKERFHATTPYTPQRRF